MKMPGYFHNFNEKYSAKFKYTPRYYDEEKEKRKARNKKIIRKANLEKTEEGRQKLEREEKEYRDWFQEKMKTENRVYNTRILFIVIILILFSLFLIASF